ncbi:MAG: hypothetical protein ACREDI_04835 [Roseiarcus sp.]
MFARERPGQCAIVAALAFGALQCVCPVSAASVPAYCASGAGPRAPVPVPKDLEADVARTFGVPVDLVRRGAFVRCAKDKLLACSVGANLNCGKANTRRSLPGASEFCRANPDADNIPMAATGHDTIYAWRCVGARAVAAKTVVAVDPDGYDADNWKEVDR